MYSSTSTFIYFILFSWNCIGTVQNLITGIKNIIVQTYKKFYKLDIFVEFTYCLTILIPLWFNYDLHEYVNETDPAEDFRITTINIKSKAYFKHFRTPNLILIIINNFFAIFFVVEWLAFDCECSYRKPTIILRIRKILYTHIIHI